MFVLFLDNDCGICFVPMDDMTALRRSVNVLDGRNGLLSKDGFDFASFTNIDGRTLIELLIPNPTNR